MTALEWIRSPESVLQLLAQLRLARAAEAAPQLRPLEVSFAGHAFDAFALRSEDVRFSPSGMRVAVVTTQRKILLFAVNISARPVRAELLTTFTSDDLDAPHGIDWIDEDTLVAANRGGPGFAFFRIPRANAWDAETDLTAAAIAGSQWFGASGELRKLRERQVLTGPGTVRFHEGCLYAGCNKSNTITRHRVFEGLRCSEGELVAHDGIEIPDSAVPSPDGAWLAVGDHDHHRVLIFPLGERKPCAQLSDPRLGHPHGVAFHESGTALVVADAGGRELYVFHAPDGAWNIDQSAASSSVEGVAAPVFDRVKAETAEMVRHLEGGTKGVDFHRGVVVSTCRGQTLRFFALHAPAVERLS